MWYSDTKLDDCTSRSVQNAWIVLLSTLTLHPSKWMTNSEVCTLYDRKKEPLLNKLYDISRMLCLVAFRLFQAYVCCYCFYNWYASLISSFLLPLLCVCLYYFAHGTNSLNFFRVFLKHSEFFQSVWFEFEENPPFYFLPSIIYTLIRLKKLIEGPGTHYCCY